MTDQDLIAKLEEHGPDGLTPAELELLRERLAVSAELQQFVFSEIRLEEAIAGALGKPGVTADRVLQLAARASPARKWMARFGWLVTMLAIVGGPIVWWNWQNPKPKEHEPVRAVARKEPKKLPAETPRDDAQDTAKSPEPVPSEPENGTTTPVPKSTAPAVVRPAPAPDEPEPSLWPELEANKNPPKPVEELETFDVIAAGSLDPNELRRWLEGVPGQPHRFRDDRRRDLTISGFDGLVRLRPKWVENAVVRFAPFDCDQMSIHLWAGEQGVTLTYHQQVPGWSAYVTGRAGQTPRPIHWTLAATDADRFQRTALGPVELRYQDGSVILSRGPLRLMTVPLSEAPQEIYFDRRALFRHFSMFLGDPLPDDAVPAVASVLAELPASLKWEPHVDKDAEFEIRDDGTVRLVASKASETAWSLVKLPRPSVYEFIAQLEEMSPGTGLCFADAEGQPVYTIGYLRERRSGGITFASQPQNAGFESNLELGVRPVPMVHARHWLRVVFGSGFLRVFTSGDAKHWSPVGDPIRNVRGGIHAVGLICLKHKEPRSIVLRNLQVRELAPLTELAAADLCDTVPERVTRKTPEFSAWLAAVLDTQRTDATPDEWRTVCAIQTLAHVPSSRLGNAILNGLLEDQLRSEKPLEQRIRLLRQVAEVYDAWEGADCLRLINWYERLGLQAANEGHPKPWTEVGQQLLSAPFDTSARFPPITESLVRTEVYGYLAEDDWADADAVCDRVRFFAQPSHPDQDWSGHLLELKLLVNWVHGTPDPTVARRGNRRRSRNTPSTIKYRHPLVVDLSKEAFNTLGEVQSALSEGSWREACQVISTVNLATAQGLLPDAKDARLLVSLPQAVDAAMRDYPPLRQTMVAEFGPIAMLRVNEAIVDGNAVALEAAAVQFHGTEAASNALRWLGDRWLAAGEFARASAAFQQAVLTAAPAQQGELRTRVRLCAALMGRETGNPPMQPVVFQEQQLEPGEFEQLVADLRARSGASTGSHGLVAVESRALAMLPRPVRYDVGPRLTLPVEAGKNPNNWPRGDADWLAWQLAGQVSGDLLYLSNRFSILAVDLAGGTVKWNTPLGSEPAEAHAWHLTRMKPVVAGGRVFARRLAKDGPELVALDAAKGEVRWKKKIPDLVLSDPLVVEDALLVLSATAAQDGLLHVSLTSIDPESGEIRTQRPLVRLLDAWYRQAPCEASLVGGRIVATLGGSVLCCDVMGQVLWVRRQMWAPPTHERRSWDQPVAAPIDAGDRLVAAQPGVMAVECIDSATGRQLWQKVVEDLRRVVGVTAARVVVEGEGRLMGLSLVDGSRVWETPLQRLQAGHVIATNGQILAVRTDLFSDKEPARPQLVWLDAVTGHETAAWTLGPLQEKLPRVGPLFVRGDDIVLLWSKHDRDIERELVVLKTTSDPAFVRATIERPLKNWAEPAVPPRLARGVECVLAGWLCLGGSDEPSTGLVSEHRNQRDVCATLATPEQPVTFVQEVAVPEGKRTRLNLLAGCQENEAWTLEVRIAGRPLETLRIEDTSTTSGWKDLQVDLSEFAGRTITLVVEHQFSGKPARAFWKRLDVTSE